MINFSILSRPVLIFYVSLSITDSCLRSIKKGLVVETSLALIYILPYYFHIPYYFHVPYFFNLIYHIFTDISYDVIVIFYFYLTQTNLLLFNIPTKFMINKKKTFFGGDLCVVCHALKIFSQDAVLQRSTGCSQKKKISCHQLW